MKQLAWLCKMEKKTKARLSLSMFCFQLGLMKMYIKYSLVNSGGASTQICSSFSFYFYFDRARVADSLCF